MKQTIVITEQVGIGNFCGDTPEEQEKYAMLYSKLLEKYLVEFCGREFPQHELEVNLPVERVSGCTQPLSVMVMGYNTEEDFESATELGRDIEYIVTRYAEQLGYEIYH